MLFIIKGMARYKALQQYSVTKIVVIISNVSCQVQFIILVRHFVK